MNIYEVIFNGSTSEQPNKDTIYLVRAPDFRSAVDEVANNAPRGKQERTAHVVFEIGKDLSLMPEEHPQILRGPYTETAYNRGWRAWYRKIKGSEYSNEWGDSPLAE
jgi:hypothetical protein